MKLKNRAGKNNPHALWVRCLINQRGWTFERLAVELGASFGSVKNWYHGHTIPLTTYRQAIQKLYQKENP